MPETLHASEAPAEELEQVAELVANLPQGSPVAVFLQYALVNLNKGKDVACLDVEEHKTPNEAAALLGMSRPHLLKLIRAGELSATPIGTHHRIPVSELVAFIDRRERGKAAVASAYGAPDVVETVLRDSAGELTTEDIATLNAL